MVTALLSAALVINELMASNAGIVMSPATNFDSWIEVYNPGEEAVNLGGMYLSNDAQNLKLWQLPSNIGMVPAKGFKVLWLGSNDILSTHAPFKLDCDGDTIFLSDRQGELVVSQDYPASISRSSYARTSDGGEDWGWTADVTPGESNATSHFASTCLSAPEVSVGSCLFDRSIVVNVDIPEGAILMYTTDGSLPVSTVEGEGTAKQSTTGKFNVSSTKSYVFRLFKDGYLPSPPVTRSYIRRDKNFTIPIISIVGDDRYFNDSMWGIDVKGENGIPGNGRDDAVNWNQPWNRPVNFSYISPDGKMLFNQDVNISVSGGWSRKDAPRSFKLKSSKEFDGLNHLDYPFFPQKPYIRSKALLIRNGGNDSWCRFKDPTLTTMVQRSGIDLDVQSTVQVAEYVNGKFKGVLNLREPNNDKFVYANWGYDDEEIDAFENDEFKNGTAEAYYYLIRRSSHINDEGIYDEVKTLLDIDEFTNYMAAELYLGNSDWPNNNVKGYRSRNDGRFRFVLFDLDQVFNYYCPMTSISTLETNQEFANTPLVRLFKNLLGHDEYRKKFLDTFCLMGGSVFERQRVTSMVNELADKWRPMLQLDGRNPDNTANEIKTRLDSRLDVAFNQLQEYKPAQTKGLKKQNVQLSVDTDGAKLLVNGLNVPYASFKGYLFPPVTLEAKAPAGYTFAGWKKGNTSLTTIIKYSSQWRFYDAGEAPSGWQTAGFDDRGWTPGKAPLGYTMNGVVTTVSYGNDSQQKHPTTYFRQSITLSKEPAADDIFVLNYQVDDGFVVYVNGREAGRVNMPDGTVRYDTFSQTYAGDTPMEGDIELPATLFHAGSNIVAVEVHNTSYTSSDLYWAASLQTTNSDAEVEITSTDPVISLPDDDRLSLVAMFQPMSDEERAADNIVPVRINEVSAANGIYVNEYFKRSDWVELYNTTDQPVDVEGMYLSDDPSDPQKYQIEAPFFTSEELWGFTPYGLENQGSTVIPPHGFLIVWCDSREALTQLHTTFKIAADGGNVLLTSSDETWSDQLTYTAMNEVQTVGRFPDGASDVYLMDVPTISKPNNTSSYATIPSVAILIGDVNCDGVVDVADVSAVISFMAGDDTGVEEVRADVNGDGAVDVADISAIISIMAGE
ncbi:MAG: CotH kinase family protein [Prevotella sp.]|nr:CotH kinase family protein [Prevotella sp.]